MARRRPLVEAKGAVPSQTVCLQCNAPLTWVRNRQGTFVPVSVEDQQRGRLVPHWQKCKKRGEKLYV